MNIRNRGKKYRGERDGKECEENWKKNIFLWGWWWEIKMDVNT